MAKKPPRALLMDSDSDEIRTAIEWATDQNLPVRRVSDHQIKIGRFNLWPNTSSWNEDGAPHKQTGGFRTFNQAVLDWWSKENNSLAISLGE